MCYDKNNEEKLLNNNANCPIAFSLETSKILSLSLSDKTTICMFLLSMRYDT